MARLLALGDMPWYGHLILGICAFGVYAGRHYLVYLLCCKALDKVDSRDVPQVIRAIRGQSRIHGWREHR